MRKNHLSDVVLYSKKKKHPTINLEAVVKQLEEPTAVVSELTDKYGLDRANDAAHDTSS